MHLIHDKIKSEKSPLEFQELIYFIRLNDYVLKLHVLSLKLIYIENRIERKGGIFSLINREKNYSF